MFRNAKFSKDIGEIIVDVSDKFYNGSQLSMSDLEFSKLSGIEVDILEWYYSWCILDDGIYFFKNHDIFNELFMSELAYEFMIRCVTFKLARDTSISRISDVGLISKLYRQKDKEYLMYSDFCRRFFSKFINDLFLFRKESEVCFGSENTDVLMNDIFKLISFDIFTGQWDRGEHNFYFECGNDNVVRLSPLCDNGLVFSEDLNCFCPFGDFSLSSDNYYDYDSLVKLLKREDGMRECFLKLLDIDIKKVLERTCDKYRILFSLEDENKLLEYFDVRKKEINKILKLVKR